VRTYILPNLNSPLTINEDGTLAEETIQIFKADAETPLEQMEIENIAAAASRLDDKIGDLPGLPKGKSERFTSRLVRALSEASQEEADAYKAILKEHNITFDQLGPLFAAEISRAGELLGSVGRAAQKN
jgi:hypothetical protein